MRFLRQRRCVRFIAAVLLASLAPAVVAPLAFAGAGHSASLYARWLEDRIAVTAPDAAVQAVRDAASGPASSLGDFVTGVVRTLASEEGILFTSVALTGHLMASESEVIDFLLGSSKSLGPNALPQATQIGQHDASRSFPQRSDRGIQAAPGPSFRSGDASHATVAGAPAEVRRLRPGRGDLQPLGP